MKISIGVLDYGIGNFRSVENMLRQVGEAPVTVSRPDDLKLVSHLILPGVGSFDRAMELLEVGNWVAPLLSFVDSKDSRLLGICLGAQILGSSSDEGTRPGLGLLDFKCERFTNTTSHKVPHMQWNTVSLSNSGPLWLTPVHESRFYFAHSYFMNPGKELVCGVTEYGRKFASIVGGRNIVGFQFHPEKSHKFGLQALAAFASWR